MSKKLREAFELANAANAFDKMVNYGEDLSWCCYQQAFLERPSQEEENDNET